MSAHNLDQLTDERIRTIRGRVADLKGFPTVPRFGAGDMGLVLEELDAEKERAERAEADAAEWKRLFTECHPIHLDGVLRAQKLETERDALRARIEAAPHAPGCRRMDGFKCICWKSAALAGVQPEAAPEPCRVCRQVKGHDGAAHDASSLNHAVATPELVDEEFCSRCLAGVGSDEHHGKCVVSGHAEMGESAPEPEGGPRWIS